MNLAIIPARYGSVGIPRKNIIDFCGKPLVQHTIEAAIESKLIDEVLVTSDDNDVLEIASSLGIKNICKRPKELASNNTPMFDVVAHALDWFFETNGKTPDNFMLLQPSSPLRNSTDIDAAVNLFNIEKAVSLISVHKLSEHPYECIKINHSKWEFLEKPAEKAFRRQDFSQNYFYINGAIYLLKTDLFFKFKNFLVEGKSLLYEMPKERGIDIDDLVDLKIAKSIFELKPPTL